ncbi:MAG TPA: hypothetical protein VI653_20800 [Steroidobacteraceae bacterium]
MSIKVALTTATLVLAYSASASAFEFGPSSMFSVDGFGTLGVVHSNLQRADFSSIYLQPIGAGYTRDWSPNVDSVLGLQGTATYDKWKFLIQGVSRETARDSFTPHIDWANLSYSITDNLSARVGRFAVPTYLFSDTRLVHYAMTAVRPSVEVYRLLPLTTADGASLSYKFHTGDVTHTVMGMYGKNTTDLSPTTYARNTNNQALIDNMEIGDFTIHAAFQKREFAVVTPAAHTVTAKQHYKVGDIAVSYDNGRQFAMIETVHTWLQSPQLSVSSIASVINVGQRFGKFSPYIQYGVLHPLVDKTLIGARAPSSNTKTVGLRWDFHTNLALKVQYDRAQAGNRSNGTFVNVQPRFPVDSSADVLSLSLDFVL